MQTPSILASYRSVWNYLDQCARGLSRAQLLDVPDGLRNNIIWNLGHLVLDNGDMLYRPAGLDPPHPGTFLPLFDAGTSPANWTEAPSVPEVLQAFRAHPERLAHDIDAGRFAGFDPSLVISGWPVADFDETLAYATVHAGIHLGAVMAIRRLVSRSAA